MQSLTLPRHIFLNSKGTEALPPQAKIERCIRQRSTLLLFFKREVSMPSAILLRSGAWQSVQEWCRNHPRAAQAARRRNAAERKRRQARAAAFRSRAIEGVMRQDMNPGRKALCRVPNHGFKRSDVRRNWRGPNDSTEPRYWQGGLCDGRGKRSKWDKDE
jgi:hypothetical protein